MTSTYVMLRTVQGENMARMSRSVVKQLMPAMEMHHFLSWCWIGGGFSVSAGCWVGSEVQIGAAEVKFAGDVSMPHARAAARLPGRQDAWHAFFQMVNMFCQRLNCACINQVEKMNVVNKRCYARSICNALLDVSSCVALHFTIATPMP